MGNQDQQHHDPVIFVQQAIHIFLLNTHERNLHVHTFISSVNSKHTSNRLSRLGNEKAFPKLPSFNIEIFSSG